MKRIHIPKKRGRSWQWLGRGALVLLSLLINEFMPMVAQDLPSPLDESPFPDDWITPEQEVDPQETLMNTLPFLHYGVGITFEGLHKYERLGYRDIDPKYQNPFLLTIPLFVEVVIASKVGLQVEVSLDSGLLTFDQDAASFDRLSYTFYYKMYLNRHGQSIPSDSASPAASDAAATSDADVEGLLQEAPPNDQESTALPQDEDVTTPTRPPPKRSQKWLFMERLDFESFALGAYYRTHPNAFYESYVQGSYQGINRRTYGLMTSVYIDQFLVMVGFGKEYLHTVDSAYQAAIDTNAFSFSGFFSVYYTFSLSTTLFSKKPNPPELE